MGMKRQRRRWAAQNRDQRRSEVKQKNDDHQADNDGFLKQIAPYRREMDLRMRPERS